ncbi:MAG: stage III sporulation AC/AD family protein [Clostridia bacterium]|nr:stage III sporulation AC/AD family protein [Clostridia bacterium]
MLIKILGIGVCTLLINIVLKQYKPEFSLLANVCGGLIIFMLVLNEGKLFIEEIANFGNYAGVKTDIISPILKVIGIGYITEFTSDLAEDCGNKSISNKVVLGGKVAICISAFPIIKNLTTAILSII